MRRLNLKFIFIYILFGFVIILVTAGLTNLLIYNSYESSEASSLYREATFLSGDYLSSYFSQEDRSTASQTVRSYLDGARSYLESSLWLVGLDGKVLASSTSPNMNSAPSEIAEFEPVEAGINQYQIGNYHGYFSEDVITVLVPVTQGFSTRGYLLIHKPIASVENRTKATMKYVYLTVAILFVLSFVILLAIHFLILLPLQKITAAATQYASGNLDYEIPIHTQDEMGYLSASLNYMAHQIKDMEDYQKKFIANVSHDFRSPLTSIKGYVEAIADGTISPEKQGKYLDIIHFETERLTDLTSDLLTLNEFDTKELLLEKTDFDIHEMIKNTAASLEGRCTSHRISIELVFATKTLSVHADRSKIQQVVYNLIDNAIKFSPDESTITIETTEQSEKVMISVKDEGIGIPKGEQTKVWERFYKSDLSRGKDKKGTGLGLAIVKEIIQTHGENVNVISTEGVGTEFIFSLALTKP